MAFVAPCGRQRAEYEGKVALPGTSERGPTCECKVEKSECASGRSESAERGVDVDTEEG
jgi:hypothetical protein